MKQSEKNRSVIENFILHFTHENKDEATGEAKSMYDALEDYIREDHVDGVDADQYVDEVADAKRVLKEADYFIDNLWTVEDVQSKFPEATPEQAQDILHESLTNEATMEQIWFSISEFGQSMYNLEEKEDEDEA